MEELKNYFSKARDDLSTSRTEAGGTNEPGAQTRTEQSREVRLEYQAEGMSGEQAADNRTERTGRREEREGRQGGEESLKLSIVETQWDESP